MPVTTIALLVVLGVFVFLFVVIAAVGSLSIFALAKAQLQPLSDNDQAALAKRGENMVDGQWLQSEGFEWVGGYIMRMSIGAPKIAAWKQSGSPTFLCVYFMDNGQTNIDIVSIFSSDVGLTTATNKDGHLLPPRRGHWIQSFTNMPTAELWVRHVEAEAVVAEACGITPRDAEQPFAELFLDAIQQQTAYVRSLLFWPLRIPFWYVWRRNRLGEKTVAEQLGAEGVPIAGGAHA